MFNTPRPINSFCDDIRKWNSDLPPESLNARVLIEALADVPPNYLFHYSMAGRFCLRNCECIFASGRRNSELVGPPELTCCLQDSYQFCEQQFLYLPNTVNQESQVERVWR